LKPTHAENNVIAEKNGKLERRVTSVTAYLESNKRIMGNK